MAINVGSRPEQMLRGVDRAVAVLADAVPQAPTRSRHDARVPTRWLIERGTTRIKLPVDVLGGFPGSLRTMNRLDRVHLTLTVRYLVVGEGTSHGFAIPMRDVLAATVERPSRRANEGVRVWYRDGNQTGSFFVGIRGLRRGMSGMTRAGQVLQFLIERGVSPMVATGPHQAPVQFLSWDAARDLADEELIFAENGTASIGGWFGAERDYCRIWVTHESLLWAGAHQSGVNRIALADIIVARDGSGDGVCIGVADELGHRFDLAFDLAPEQVELDRNASPRVRFMNVLASQRVPVGTVSTPLAPWRAGRVVHSSERLHQTQEPKFALS